MQANLWDLQLFADGGDGGASGEAGSASGVTPAAAGQEQQQETVRDRLRQMGVPEDMLKNRAYDAPADQRGTPHGRQGDNTADAAQGAEGENPPQQQEQKQKPTWRELMQDPDYNAEMNKTVQRRVSKFKATSEAMEKLSPALEMLAKHYGMDPERMDYDALARSVMDDDAYYQQRALDMGVSVDVAKKLDAAERLEEARRRDEAMNEQDRQIRAHFADLEAQAAKLREKYPGFDLQQEMQNDNFARLTVPGSGLSVEDAYFAVHREEIMEQTRQQIAAGISSSIRAGQNRPNESGKKTQTAPAKDINQIRHMPKDRQEELVRRAMAGEVITPDMLYG